MIKSIYINVYQCIILSIADGFNYFINLPKLLFSNMSSPQGFENVDRYLSLTKLSYNNIALVLK